MGRADWAAAERAFNRGEGSDMGAGCWSRWGRGSCEGHALEFGFSVRLDIKPGSRSNGVTPDFWSASSREGSLGDFPSFEAAAMACEIEAKRSIEAAIARGDTGIDMTLVVDHWKMYLALPHRLRSRKSSSRRR